MKLYCCCNKGENRDKGLQVGEIRLVKPMKVRRERVQDGWIQGDSGGGAIFYGEHDVYQCPECGATVAAELTAPAQPKLFLVSFQNTKTEYRIWATDFVMALHKAARAYGELKKDNGRPMKKVLAGEGLRIFIKEAT